VGTPASARGTKNTSFCNRPLDIIAAKQWVVGQVLVQKTPVLRIRGRNLSSSSETSKVLVSRRIKEVGRREKMGEVWYHKSMPILV
jgi:hypothetical protein